MPVFSAEELQSILAFEAYEQEKTSGLSMIPDMHQAVFDRYHGKGDDAIGLVKKFIGGNEMLMWRCQETHCCYM